MFPGFVERLTKEIASLAHQVTGQMLSLIVLPLMAACNVFERVVL